MGPRWPASPPACTCRRARSATTCSRRSTRPPPAPAPKPCAWPTSAPALAPPAPTAHGLRCPHQRQDAGVDTTTRCGGWGARRPPGRCGAAPALWCRHQRLGAGVGTMTRVWWVGGSAPAGPVRRCTSVVEAAPASGRWCGHHDGCGGWGARRGAAHGLWKPRRIGGGVSRWSRPVRSPRRRRRAGRTRGWTRARSRSRRRRRAGRTAGARPAASPAAAGGSSTGPPSP